MLKPMRQKVEWALTQPGVTRARLVEVTGVAGVSAVSEWLRTGRIAKAHIPKVAALTNTREAWWLDDEAPVPPTDVWRVTPPDEVKEPPPIWLRETISDERGAMEFAARRAAAFLRRHAETLTPSDRRMFAQLLSSYVGDVDASEKQLEAIGQILGKPPSPRRSREYDSDATGPVGSPPEIGYAGSPPARKLKGRRKK